MQTERRRHQACEACKARKVRCNGQQKCQQCNHLNLRCEYLAPKVRQDRAARGKRIAQCRQEDSRLQSSESIAILARPESHPRSNDDVLSPYTPPITVEDSTFFADFLHDYEVYVYPFHPIIPVNEAQRSIVDMDVNTEARAFVYGLVAISLNLTHSLRAAQTPNLSSDPGTEISQWTYRALQVMGPLMSDEDITVRRIATVQFLHVCLMGLRQYELAFYYLRQSVSMVQMLRIEDESTSMSPASPERARRERLYWEVFIHERFYAISNQRSVILAPLQRLPDIDPTIPYSIHHGFAQIIRLFAHVDSDFLTKWFATFKSVQPDITPEWTKEKHQEFDAETAGDDDEVHGLLEMQQADLVITKHWLRMLVWQIAMSQCLLSSAASDLRMSLQFPVGVSSRLRRLLTGMSKQAIEVHGSGIQQKLFELTDTIANVLLTVPATSMEDTRQRLDDFQFLYDFWITLPRPEARRKQLLESKFEKLHSLILHT